MRKKDLLAAALCNTGILGLIGKLNSLLTKKIIVLAYHRVVDIENLDNFPFDPNLISASSDSFSRQMDYIKDHFNCISLQDLIDHLNNKLLLPKRPIIITFDDGYRDNYEIAYPILKSRNIPASIFVATDYIGSNKIFWFDYIAYLIFHTSQNQLTLDDKQFIIGKTSESRRQCSEKILQYLKSLPNRARLDAIEKIRLNLNIAVDEKDNPLSATLSWEHIKEMSQNRIEFGSHSKTHPILSQLEQKELIQELSESKSALEFHINKPINIIAYPEGGYNEYSISVILACKEAGYELGVSYVAGTQSENDISAFEIRRLHVENDISMEYFKSMLELPSIFRY